MTVGYPQLAAAVARVRQNRRHADHHIKCEACAAQQEALKAYAEELLPDILGGQWTVTDRYGWPPFYGNRGTSAGGSIYDHETVFRQRGAHGPNSWRNCAVISQPYNAHDHDGILLPSFPADAAALAAQHNVGVWVRADLSSWLPGSTSLVLVARGLHADLARHFGFHGVA